MNIVVMHMTKKPADKSPLLDIEILELKEEVKKKFDEWFFCYKTGDVPSCHHCDGLWIVFGIINTWHTHLVKKLKGKKGERWKRTWVIEETEVTTEECVSCPDCGFTFSKDHENDGELGVWSCPACAELNSIPTKGVIE